MFITFQTNQILEGLQLVAGVNKQESIISKFVLISKKQSKMKNVSTQPHGANNRKVFDSVYGFISFPKQIWQFIDTPHFQRLRNIKQLGCLSWVFPGAVPTRFQHSLGTGHLAQKYITTLIEKHKVQKINPIVYKSYYGDNEDSHKYKSTIQQAIFTVTLAGTLHDIGHGPYSHLFDSKVVSQVDGKRWEHEIASLCLIDALYEYVIKQKTNQQEINWLKSTKNRVKSLTIGKIMQANYKVLTDGTYVYDGQVEVENLQQGFNQVFKHQLKTRPWQFELISNRLTGIDVDKLDYFRRDAYYLGAKNIYIDHELLMNQTLILQEQQVGNFDNTDEEKSQRHRLCYPTKYSDKVYDIYYSRYRLYKTYYMNLKANGVDFMMAEILHEAEPYFKLKQACRLLLHGDCEKYIRLTDSILDKIEDVYDIAKEKEAKGQELDDNLKGIMRAGKILERLKRRQIYDFVKQYHKSFSFPKICAYYKIKDMLKKMIKQQTEKNNNIVLHCSQIGFGIKDKDPFEQCRFYDKSLETKVIQSSNERNFSMLRPDGIIQLSLRLYLKNRVKNPTQQDKQRIKLIENTILQRVSKIDRDFISGQSGTYTNRSQQGSLSKQQQLQAQKLKISKSIDNTL